MSRYRGLKYGARHGAKSGYLTKEDLYRILEKYQRRYRNQKYPRPKYRGKSSGRTGRSTSKYRPRQQSTRNPAPKYKKMPKLNLSSPLRETPIRYSHQSNIFRTEIDAEQLANEIEKKLDSKLSKILLEKLEAEIEGLQLRIESKGINEKINENLETAEVETKTEDTEILEREVEKETIEYAREIEAESQKESEVETNQEAEVEDELIEMESPEKTENLPDVEAGEIEGETETPEEADHLEAYIIDEEWIDEDGLNTLFRSEPEPEQIDQEAEVFDETELIPPDIGSEAEPIDEVIEPEETGVDA